MASRSLSANSSSSSLSSTSTSLSSASASTSATSLHSSSSSSSLVPPRKRASPPPAGNLGCSSGILKRKAASPTKLQLAMKATPREVAVAALTVAKKEKEACEYRALQQQVQGLCEPQYIDEVRSYMQEMEGKTKAAVETIDMQPELQWYMRPYLLDFLIEIHQQYRLRPETLYLAVNIIDRYVSKRIVYKKHYQLVGCAALWIAAKFEDAKDRVPTVQELGQMCCGAYEESAFIQMEGHVLSTIGWVLGHPTAEAWLRLKCSAEPGLGLEEQKTQHVARFLMEITLFHRAFVGLKASDTASASLLLARFILHKSRRPLEETAEVLEVVQLLDAHLADHLELVSAIVVKKYSFSFYSRAATLVREFYLSGHRFTPVPLPVFAPLTRSVSSVSACSGDGDSALSSPTSSCGMASSPRSISSDGMCCNDQEACCSLCAGAQSVSIAGDGPDCDMYTEYDEEAEELPRYAAVDSFKGAVTVKENVRERDMKPLAMSRSKEAVSAAPREALRNAGWDANVVPMSC